MSAESEDPILQLFVMGAENKGAHKMSSLIAADMAWLTGSAIKRIPMCLYSQVMIAGCSFAAIGGSLLFSSIS